MRKKYKILPIILLCLVLLSSTEAKDADDYEYLIVTTDILKDHWGDFIDAENGYKILAIHSPREVTYYEEV